MPSIFGVPSKRDALPRGVGIKQGDVISPAFFNAGLLSALQNGKRKLELQNFDVGFPKRFGNIRFVGDFVLFAESWHQFFVCWNYSLWSVLPLVWK